MSNNEFFLFDMALMEKIELFDGIVFGRDEVSDIFVDDEMVSGSHFKIKIIDYDVYVIDLNSSNETLVNDVALKPDVQYKLNAKDVIRVGDQEYAYSSTTVGKLNLPELSRTLEVGRFDEQSQSSLEIERLENDQIYDESDSLPKVEIHQPKGKPETGLKSLRKAKKYLDDLQLIQKGLIDKISELKKMRRKKIEVGAKMDQMKKIMEKSVFKNIKDFEKELRIFRGTIEGYKLKVQKEESIISKARAVIEKEEEKIAQAKFNISSLEGQTKKSAENLDTVNREFDIFKSKGAFEKEFESLKKSIKSHESLNLDDKKKEVEEEMKLKTAQYKDMQSHYGAKLNSEIKKKAASE